MTESFLNLLCNIPCYVDGNISENRIAWLPQTSDPDIGNQLPVRHVNDYNTVCVLIFFLKQKKYPHVWNTTFDNQQLSSVKFSWITRALFVTLLGLLLSRLHVYILQGVYICHNHSHEMHIIVPCNAPSTHSFISSYFLNY